MYRLNPNLVGLLASAALISGCASLLPGNPRSNQRTGESVTVRLQYEPVQEAGAAPLAIPLITQAVDYSIKWLGSAIKEEGEQYKGEFAGTASGIDFYQSSATNTINLKGIHVQRHIALEGKPTLAFDLVLAIDSSAADAFRLVAKTARVDYAKAKVAVSRWFLPWSWFDTSRAAIDADIEVTFEPVWIDNGKPQAQAMPTAKLSLRNLEFGNEITNLDSASGWIPLLPRTTTSDGRSGRGTYSVKVLVREFDDFGERVHIVSDTIESKREDWVEAVEKYLQERGE